VNGESKSKKEQSQVFGLNSEEHGDDSMEPKVAEDEAELGTDRDKRAQQKAALDMEKVAIAADEKCLRLLKEDEAERRELAREEAEVALRRAREFKN